MLIKTTHKAIKAALYDTVHNCGQELVTNGSENLMIGGNKAYYKGGGAVEIGLKHLSILSKL